MNEKEPVGITTLGGGCFWCLEAVFSEIQGVIKVVSAYSGGKTENPNYKQVITGVTGHAEVVQITFDTKKISYEKILEIFFTIHDPTQLNRQGYDVGTQYRSVIFYHSEYQKEIATRVIHKLEESNEWGKPIVTELTPFNQFYIAEEYHQNLLELKAQHDLNNSNPCASGCENENLEY